MDRKRHTTRYPGCFYRLKTNGDRQYGVSYVDAQGRAHTKMLPVGANLEDAKTLKADLDGKAKQGYVPSRKTVSELLDEWLVLRKGDIAPHTYATYKLMVENHLKKAFGRRRVEELSPSDVARLVSDMKAKGLKAWTIRKALSPLSGAYAVAVRDGHVSSSPVGKLLPHERPVKDAGEKRILSLEEIEKLLGSTLSQNNKEESLRWKALFALLVFTGLRISEALALTWEDVTENSVHVRKAKTPAGVREVMMIPALKRLLSALKLSQAPGVEYVFATRQGAACGRRAALRAMKACCRRADIPEYTPHELRHTFAALMIAQRETLPFIQKQMGHANPEVTLRVYAKLFEEQQSITQARERLQEAVGGLV